MAFSLTADMKASSLGFTVAHSPSSQDELFGCWLHRPVPDRWDSLCFFPSSTRHEVPTLWDFSIFRLDLGVLLDS
jgi:hypothetical protein